MTLIEVMIASLILAVGVIGTVSMVDQANRTTSKTRAREAATNVSREVIEAARDIGFSGLDPATATTQLQATPGLTDAQPGNPWTVERRGTTFTLSVSVCSFDDRQDGFGAHDSSITWCSDSGGPGTTDTNGGEDYKRVTTTVTWPEEGKTRTARHSSLINNGSRGPAITTFNGPTGITLQNNQIVAGTNAAFSVTTSSGAKSVEWYLDGEKKGNASGTTGTTGPWTFTWNLGNSPCGSGTPVGSYDGGYFLAAQGYGNAGDSTGPRSKVLTLNRCSPLAPSSVAGGRNLRFDPDAVELEWRANYERDIVGYRVYRSGSPSTPLEGSTRFQQTCAGKSTFSEASCVFDAPAATDNYYVRAVDRDPSGALREGPSSPLIAGSTASPTPNVVRNVVKTGSASTSVQITWDDPTANAERFYRVYRGGTALENRYWRSGDTSIETFTDTTPNGQPYYVVAVGSGYSEGPFFGPVNP